MKKFYLTVGGILTIVGSGLGYNEFDVEITTSDQKVIVFNTKRECKTAKKEIIGIFEKKELSPDQAFVLKAFVSQPCGTLLEESVPSVVDNMTVTETNVYYTKAKYNEKKDALYKKTKESPDQITIFEQRELIGIVNEEMKKAGKKGYKSISPNDIILELEKK